MSSSTHQAHNTSNASQEQPVDLLLWLNRQEHGLRKRWVKKKSEGQTILWGCSLNFRGQDFKSTALYPSLVEAKRDVVQQIFDSGFIQPIEAEIQPKPDPEPLSRNHREVELIEDQKPTFQGKFYRFSMKELKERTYLSENRILAVQDQEPAGFRGDLLSGKYAISPRLIDIGGPLEFQE